MWKMAEARNIKNWNDSRCVVRDKRLICVIDVHLLLQPEVPFSYNFQRPHQVAPKTAEAKSSGNIWKSLPFIAEAAVFGGMNDQMDMKIYMQCLGIWYQVGLLIPQKQGPLNMCEWFNTKLHTTCQGCFKDTYGNLPNGENNPRPYGIGAVINGAVHVSYPTIERVSHVYEVVSFNGGKELILHDPLDKRISKVLSRTATVSIETKTEFEKIAEHASLYPTYVNPEHCQPS